MVEVCDATRLHTKIVHPRTSKRVVPHGLRELSIDQAPYAAHCSGTNKEPVTQRKMTSFRRFLTSCNAARALIVGFALLYITMYCVVPSNFLGVRSQPPDCSSSVPF